MYLSSQLLQTVSLAQRIISALCAIWPVLFLMAACTTAGGPLQPPSAQSNPAELRVGAVLETATGKVMTMDQLIGILSKASIVYAGETHTSAEDHSVRTRYTSTTLPGGADASNLQWKCFQYLRNRFWTNTSRERCPRRSFSKRWDGKKHGDFPTLFIAILSIGKKRNTSRFLALTPQIKS